MRGVPAGWAMRLSCWAGVPAVTAAAALPVPPRPTPMNPLNTCGAEVQKGNPPTERKLQRLFRNPEVSSPDQAVQRLWRRRRVRGHRRTGRRSAHQFGQRSPTNTRAWTAQSLPSRNPRNVWRWFCRFRDDVDTFIEAADAENLEATPVAIVTGDDRLRMTVARRRRLWISPAIFSTPTASPRHASARHYPCPMPDACYLQSGSGGAER